MRNLAAVVMLGLLGVGGVGGTAACGGDSRQIVATCTARPVVSLASVGDEIVAVSRFGGGFIVAGTRFETMRVATVDGVGVVGNATAIGALLQQPITSVPLRAAIRVDGSMWTAVFPEQDSLIGYSVDTMTGTDSTYVYAPHFTNSEPLVVWMPTAFWFGPTPAETNIGMQRVEIASGQEAVTSHVWVSPVKTVELTPGRSAAPPILGIDGRHQFVLTSEGVFSYAADTVRTQTAMVPEGATLVGPAVLSIDGLAGAAIGADGMPQILRFLGDGSVVQRTAKGVAGPAVALTEFQEEGAYAWLTADGTISWVWGTGEVAGPTIPLGVTAMAPGPDLVPSGNDLAFAYQTPDGTWYLQRNLCE